ncbi:hypothetical protein BH11MYX3_BH11MYX3_37430 [soil metagenome]
MLTYTTCGGLTPSDASVTCLHCETPLRRPPRWMLRFTALLGPAGAILLAACYGAPGRYHTERPVGPNGATRVDHDGDGELGGYTCESYAGPQCQNELEHLPLPADLDCDDNDRTRYHGAADVDGDGIDQNCDGVDGWRDPSTVATPPADAGAPPE